MKHKIIKNDRRKYIRSLKDPYYFFTKYCVIKEKNTNKIINIKINRNIYERLIELKNLANLRQAR